MLIFGLEDLAAMSTDVEFLTLTLSDRELRLLELLLLCPLLESSLRPDHLLNSDGHLSPLCASHSRAEKVLPTSSPLLAETHLALSELNAGRPSPRLCLPLSPSRACRSVKSTDSDSELSLLLVVEVTGLLTLSLTCLSSHAL